MAENENPLALPAPDAIECAEDVLLSIQAELKVPKGQKNDYGGYNYRSLEDINQAIKPIALKFGSYVTYTDRLEQIGERYYISAKCRLITPFGEISSIAYAREQESRKGMDASQITGSASSYARKYAAQGLFALGGDDADSMPPEPGPAKPSPNYPNVFNVRCRRCGNQGHDFTSQAAATVPCAQCGAVDWERIS